MNKVTKKNISIPEGANPAYAKYKHAANYWVARDCHLSYAHLGIEDPHKAPLWLFRTEPWERCSGRWQGAARHKDGDFRCGIRIPTELFPDLCNSDGPLRITKSVGKKLIDEWMSKHPEKKEPPFNDWKLWEHPGTILMNRGIDVKYSGDFEEAENALVRHYKAIGIVDDELR